jgi:LuxR family transcriptional regulator, maltose regulon positive regulatory protein
VSWGEGSDARLRASDSRLNGGGSRNAAGSLEIGGPAGAPLGRRDALEPALRGTGLVRRGWLFDRLSGEGVGGVILVCAPAGSGKTVLLRSWVQAAGLQERAAWVSVERGERDAQRFWLSVIDALATAVTAVRRVDPAPGFRGEAVVAQLLDDLASLQEPAVLVVDDLHELRSADALTWFQEFLDRLPRRLRVVVVTREDPRLGLHRLRLAGELRELRVDDLLFSMEEAKELLRGAGITLSDAGMALLYERTEGWAAGLRLAAISLAHHPDPERFVAEFSGSERTVAGYLLAEVLERQPPEVRELLLRTSILDQVNGPLADHMTGGSGSERILQELEDANAFVSSLDVGRSWFRYHHLFADLLQLELRRTEPGIVGPLHRAAAEWHEQEGHIVEAVRHAQAARDWLLASRLLAEHHLDLTLDGRTAVVSELSDDFPDDAAATDPELALVFGTARLLDGSLDQSAALVDLAERQAAAVSLERRASFDLLLAELRLVLARWRGDLDTVLAALPAVEAALAAKPAGGRGLTDAIRSIALQNLGVAELWAGRLDEARHDLEQALALARRGGRPWLEIPCLGHLGIAGPWTGLSLSEGLELSEEAVRQADAHGWNDDPVIVTGLATGAITMLWLGRLEEAERWLDRAERTLHPDGEPATELIVRHARGLLRLAQGRLEEALAALRAAEREQGLLANRHPFALRTQSRLVQTLARMGQLAAARAALAGMTEEERNTSEIRVAAAEIHLVEGEPELAVDVLAPVIERLAPMTHPPSVTTEAQLLDALARDQLGDQRAAEVSLEHALELAEPEGIILPFILAPIQDILEGVPRHRTAHATLRQTILDVLAGSEPRPRGASAGLREELSEAELRVVRYLPTNLKAPEIAAELFVSTNTVRTHLRHIYGKLGAHGRTEAVARARELRLLGPSSRPRA